ncbi:MAG: hypothetical protein JWL95_389 [Gemmatimonadetes bacterium]|nr:hypothetical protein [Gemmatimonadota bacterium]
MKNWKLAVLFAPLVVAACSEVETVPTQAAQEPTTRIVSPPESAQHSISSGGQSPPADAPPEYQHYTSIDVRADVGFIGQVAWGQSVVNYSGTSATANVDLVGRNSAGTVVASNSGSAQDSHIFPSDYGLTASTNMNLPAACGISAQASARGTVWDSFFASSQSFVQWGNKAGSDTKSADQPACPPTPPPVCKQSISGLARLADCNSPPATPPAGGGDGSSPSTPSTPPPEPPPYYPPTYFPKPWTEVCYTIYPGTDYERELCYRSENNDARIGGRVAPLAALVGGPVAPQFDSKDKLPSVFVIVSDAVPAGTMAVVDRHPEGAYKNVILVRSSALRPAELVRAMRFLYDSRSKHGETPAKKLTSHLNGTIADSDVTDGDRVFAATFTSLLHKAKTASIGQYGSHPVLEIRMGAHNSN